MTKNLLPMTVSKIDQAKGDVVLRTQHVAGQPQSGQPGGFPNVEIHLYNAKGSDYWSRFENAKQDDSLEFDLNSISLTGQGQSGNRAV